MLFSKCLRAKIYCNMNVHFDPQGCQTLLLKESEHFFLSLGPWTNRFLIILCHFSFFSHTNTEYLQKMSTDMSFSFFIDYSF